MSGFDGVLIFGSLGLIILLPIVAVIGVYVMGRRNKGNFQHSIEMDGARCVQTLDGSVTIKSNIWINIAIIIFLGITLFGCGFVAFDNVSRDSTTALGQLVMVAVWAIFTVPTIIYLGRSLRKPAYYFNSEHQALEIRQGLAVRQVPFGQMGKLRVDFWQKDIGWINPNFYRPQQVPCARIKLELANGELLELGTLSSSKDEADLKERCGAICRLVAGVTGVTLPPEAFAPN